MNPESPPESSYTGESRYDPRSFDSPVVKAVALPLVIGLAILCKVSPLGFLLEGFHVWIHELGHATVAWITGHPAVPVPFGWTNVEPDRSPVLYLVILAALVALVVAGWRERKIWPIVLGLGLIAPQAFLTWELPADRAHEWMIFGGVGGEFYLTTAMVCLFFFEFPDWFRWGSCRYLVLFLGAGSLFESYAFWRQVKRGVEGIPYGSMINGEGDGGGDMNILVDDYHWTQHRIIFTYCHLADLCLLVILGTYLFFNLRLNQVFNPLLARCFAPGSACTTEESPRV
jgi:hypothetical protein